MGYFCKGLAASISGTHNLPADSPGNDGLRNVM
jgi:hypothetical protein